MGAKAKKSLKKNLKKSASRRVNELSDFLPLEGGPGRRIPDEEVDPVQNTSTVLYIGHIPHGFYEEKMEGFFKQFGKIKRLRLVRNRKTGKSKHYGFLEFENPEVAKVVADEINGSLVFEQSSTSAYAAGAYSSKVVGQIQPSSKKIKFSDDDDDEE